MSVDWTGVINRTARNYLEGEERVASTRRRELLRLMRSEGPIRYSSGRQPRMAPRPRPLFHMEDWQRIDLPGAAANVVLRCPMTGCEWLYTEARREFDLDARNIEGSFQNNLGAWYTFRVGDYPTVQEGRLTAPTPERREEPCHAGGVGTIRRRFIVRPKDSRRDS